MTAALNSVPARCLAFAPSRSRSPGSGQAPPAPRQLRLVAWFGEKTVLPLLDRFRNAGRPRRYDRLPREHGLEQGHRQAFPERWHGIDIGRRQQVGDVTAVTEEMQAPGDAGVDGECAEPRPLLAAPGDRHMPTVAVHARESAQQVDVALPRHQVSHRQYQHVLVGQAQFRPHP